MQAAQLFQHMKDNGITIDEAAAKTGYNPGYLYNVLMGHTALTDKAKFRIIEAYPATGAFLMNGAKETR